ncbi:hypothetical protein GCM10010840_30400 [Deinococcus aerolatus]|uniref:Ava_C0101 and related proteins n=1 Tax=Deinococcus aerolatus TaxID=522487 RepID=A0ABQ2GEH6_9DEIO|nr:DUF5996 family protein [Deinococcus aerolatus]GGL90257.1 hypothetical protein GCM10010840_30400 [Deinococcus aerolatus]
MTLTHDAWPPLPLEPWQDTMETLHLWTQIVGKVRLALTPWANHSWHVTLYPGARGLTTGPIHHPHGTFEIEFDFRRHHLAVVTATGEAPSFALEGLSVAGFYQALMVVLDNLGLSVEIWPRPVELSDPITPFPDDHGHAAYDPEAVARYWQALLSIHRVLGVFRSRFLGKVSPVHYFWGASDLAVTRFSGRTAPRHPGGAPNCADWVMEEAYSHELSSAGFWPGAGLGEAAFYAYAYPEPSGFRTAQVEPAAAYYHADLGEFVLPYEAVRTAAEPDATLLAFLQSTYVAAAELGHWNRAELEFGADRLPAR